MDIKQLFPNVTDSFGNWLAGFTDGEGCFAVYDNSVRFYITQRADSTEILDTIKHTLGIGNVSKNISQFKRINGVKVYGAPMSQYYVIKRPELIKLSMFFDAYPLRTAKKNGDFNIWKLAVKEYSTKDYNKAKLHYYKNVLNSVRSYNSLHDILILTDQQLDLF